MTDIGKAVVIIHPSRAQAVPANVFTEGPAPLFEYEDILRNNAKKLFSL